MDIRLATTADIEQLVQMRWDFTYEHAASAIQASYDDFYRECSGFLETAISGGKWFIWVAVVNQKIVSHIFIEQIEKVPRPGRTTQPFAYMTNVYTVPEHRSNGVGSKILQCIEEWGKERFEFIIVWPSDEAVSFYRKNGYSRCTEPMERSF